MNLLRCFLLLVVLFAVYASACHGSQTPRARGQQMGNNPMGKMEEKNKPKTDAELKIELKDFKDNTWKAADVPTYMMAKDRKDLAEKLKISEAKLKELYTYAEKSKEFDEFVKLVKDVDLKGNNNGGK